MRTVQSIGIAAAGAGKITFNPFSIRRKSAGNDASGVSLRGQVYDGSRRSA